MVKLNQILNLNGTPKLTVALPVYNGKEVAWIALESLSEQIDIDFEWELIVYEERHEQSVFPELFLHYIDRLKSVGCTKILHIDNTDKVTLVQKWIEIGKNTSPSSECYMLHAADCYSPKRRLKTSFDKIVTENFDWYDQTKGYFYSFISKRIILYDYNGFTNLNMALKTEHIKCLPNSNLKKGIDGYIYNHTITNCKKNKKPFRRHFDEELYNDSIDTHGFNNISLSRESFFDNKPSIFSIVDMSADELGWNKDVKNWVKTKKKPKRDKDLSIIIATYQNTEFINECFNSISKAIKNFDVEILVGVDGCEESKRFFEINKFPKDFKIYYFEENKGPYIIFNSLSRIVDSQNILFFASDDIMKDNMIDEILKGLSKFDCVKPHYSEFRDGQKYDSSQKKVLSEGVFAIKKDVFHYMNGFEPWMCAADSDFMGRVYKSDVKVGSSNFITFYRRIHPKGLTSRPDTGMKSKLRAEYIKLSRSKTSAGPLENMITGHFATLEGKNVTTFKTTTPKETFFTWEETQQVVVEPKKVGGIFDRSKFQGTTRQNKKTTSGQNNTSGDVKEEQNKVIEKGRVKSFLPKNPNNIIVRDR
jgi:hypothetical protein